MKKLIMIGSLLICALFVVFLNIPEVNADNEPNDTLNSAESIGEGTFTGSVEYGLLTSDDVDYYVISVPADKDLVVTAEKTDTGDSSITINSYNHNKQELGLWTGIWMYLDAPGEIDEDTWYNSDSVSRDLYLEIDGDGNYKITIEFTDDTAQLHGAVADFCFMGTIGMLCGILIFFAIVIGIIILIIWLVKRSKNKKTQPPQQPQYPPQQPQYPPQQPQYPPQQPQYPPQQPQYPPQR